MQNGKQNSKSRVKLSIDPVILQKLYVEDKLSIKQISQHFSASTSSIGNYLTKYNIPRRQEILPIVDLVGKQFGYLEVKKLDLDKTIRGSKKSTYYWLCQCRCGKEISVRVECLRNNSTKSCGCIRKLVLSQTPRNNILGQQFGTVIIKKRLENGKWGYSRWEGECTRCKNTIEVKRDRLSRTENPCQKCRYELRKSRKAGCHEDISYTFFKKMKKGAVKRNLEFSININDIWETFLKQNRKCAISGRDIYFSKTFWKTESRQTASVDRKDNSIGYTAENIHIVHKDMNHMKRHHSLEYFINFCKDVAKYNESVTNFN